MDPEELNGGEDPNLQPGVEPAEGEAPQYYLGELTEQDVLDRLSRVNEFPDTLRALEDRFGGSSRELGTRLEKLEKGLPTQPAFDAQVLAAGLADYDPKLAEVLGPLLEKAFKVTALGEDTLRPHLDPVKNSLREYMGEQLVMSAYSPEALAEIIPPVEEGRFVPQGQRHKDFVEWYGQQGYSTQQSLLSFGAPYIHALRKFEGWEQKRNKDRAAAADGKAGRLKAGEPARGGNRRPVQQKGEPTPQESFLAGFNEVIKPGG
jgi:hypothetical protein